MSIQIKWNLFCWPIFSQFISCQFCSVLQDGPVCVSSRAKWKDPVPNSFEAGNVELGTGTSLMGLHLWRHSSTLNEEESDKRQGKTETFLPNDCPSGSHPIT